MSEISQQEMRERELKRLQGFYRNIKRWIQEGRLDIVVSTIEDLEDEIEYEFDKMKTPRFRFINPTTGEVKEFDAKSRFDAIYDFQELGFNIMEWKCERIN